MNKYYGLAAMAVVFLAACTENEEIQNQGGTSLSIASASIETISTKGLFDTGGGPLTTEANIGVSASGTGYSYNNVEYYYNTTDSKWAPQSAANQIYLSDQTATVTAYAPFTSGLTASAASLTAQRYDETKDLCSSSASETAVNTDPSVIFTLSHVYSRISFTINKDASYTGVGLISAIAISNPTAVFTTALADLTATPAPTLSSPVIGTVQYDPAIASITSGTPAASSVLMIPASTFTDATTLAFTVDGVVLTATLPATDPASGGLNILEPSHNYGITVTMRGTELIVSSITVTDWTPQTVSGEILPVVP